MEREVNEQANPQRLHGDMLKKHLENTQHKLESVKKVIEQFEAQKQLFAHLPDTLRRAILVPVGKRAFFRGAITHTNEIYRNIGANYVVKQTARQAIASCERMLNETRAYLTKLRAEEDFLRNQMTVPYDAFAARDQIEIVEAYDEDRERQWRAQHRENVKKYKMMKTEEVDDRDLWIKLDELEVREEMDAFSRRENAEKMDATKSQTIKDLVHIGKIRDANDFEVIVNGDSITLTGNAVNGDSPREHEESDNGESQNVNREAPNDNRESANERGGSRNEALMRIEQIQLELNEIKANKVSISTNADVCKRLDQLEREELLLEELEILSDDFMYNNLPLSRVKGDLTNDNTCEKSGTNTEVPKVETNFRSELSSQTNTTLLELNVNDKTDVDTQQSNSACVNLEKCIKYGDNTLDDIVNESKPNETTDSITSIKPVIQVIDNVVDKENKHANEMTQNGQLSKINHFDRAYDNIVRRHRKKIKAINASEKYNQIDSFDKHTTIKFNEQVVTQLYNINTAADDVQNGQLVKISVSSSADSPDSAHTLAEPLVITFTHTQCDSSSAPSSPRDKIQKPSDLYELRKLNKLKSILKNKEKVTEECRNVNQLHAIDDIENNVQNQQTARDQVDCRLPVLKAEVKEVKAPVSTIEKVDVHGQKKRQSRFSISRSLVQK